MLGPENEKARNQSAGQSGAWLDAGEALHLRLRIVDGSQAMQPIASRLRGCFVFRPSTRDPAALWAFAWRLVAESGSGTSRMTWLAGLSSHSVACRPRSRRSASPARPRNCFWR